MVASFAFVPSQSPDANVWIQNHNTSFLSVQRANLGPNFMRSLCKCNQRMDTGSVSILSTSYMLTSLALVCYSAQRELSGSLHSHPRRLREYAFLFDVLSCALPFFCSFIHRQRHIGDVHLHSIRWLGTTSKCFSACTTANSKRLL